MNLGTEGVLDNVKIHPEVKDGGGGEMQSGGQSHLSTVYLDYKGLLIRHGIV